MLKIIKSSIIHGITRINWEKIVQVDEKISSINLKLAKQIFDNEIDELVKVKSLLEEDKFSYAIELLAECRGKVIVTGMGKSGHIANKIAATFASTGTAAFYVHPGEALHGDLGMIEASDVVVAISYSGESDELNAIMPMIRNKGVKVISITGNVTSSLARMSDCVLSVKVSKEACPLNLAPTTSTTVTLVLGDALAGVLIHVKEFKEEDFARSHPGGNLGRKLLSRVDDIMHKDELLPISHPDTDFKSVILAMSKKRLGLVAVLNNDDTVVGIITDGDLRRVLETTNTIDNLYARDMMTINPITIKQGSPSMTAVQLMENHNINSLLVVDNSNKLVGAFNFHDLLKNKLIV